MEISTMQTREVLWEILGIMVFNREISPDIVDAFFSGSIVASWNKLGIFVEDVRKETGRETRWEWFQWLSESMLERESLQPPVAAHLQHKNWKD